MHLQAIFMNRAVTMGAILGGLIGLVSLLTGDEFACGPAACDSASDARLVGFSIGLVFGRVVTSAAIGAAVFWLVSKAIGRFYR